jgi:RNA polymerase sigma factor (sigma-70 family)
MGSGASRETLRHFRTLYQLGAAGSLTDAQLIERFVARQEDAAFEALVMRHGPMVLGICRRVLPDRHDAEDAFQATFLVLVRRAGSIARPELLGNWLYGVAYRTAMEARTRSARRRAREAQVVNMPRSDPPTEEFRRDLRATLDEELSRLPAKYRAAVVLCELEGKSRKEVAHQLGLREGTVSSRLARARSLLRDRLTRRGLALTGPALVAALGREALASEVPPALLETTVHAAIRFAAGNTAAAGAVSASVAALTEGVLKTMFLTKLKMAAVVVVAGLVVTGLSVQAQQSDNHGAGPPGPDRLDQLERKLDRVLQFLEGSEHAQEKTRPSAAPTIAKRSLPALPVGANYGTTSILADHPVAAQVAHGTAPTISEHPVAAGVAYGTTPVLADHPVAAQVAHRTPPIGGDDPPVAPDYTAATRLESDRIAVAERRLDRVEQRLEEVVRRLETMERGTVSRSRPEQSK